MNRLKLDIDCAVGLRSRTERSRSRGSALLVVLIFAVGMIVALAAVLTYVNSAAKLEKRSNLRLESTYAAEYAFEEAFQQLKTLISQYNLPNIAQTTAVTNLSTAPTSVFTTAGGYTWKSYLTVPVENGIVTDKHSNYDPVQGIYRYLTVAEFERTVPTMGLPVRMSFQREWVYVLKPLFQYAIFYDKDMELFPGATFLVTGRVHSNGKIYTGTSASIHFKDFVSYVDGLSNQYSPLDPRAPGSPGGTIIYDKDPVMTTREDPPGSVTADTSDSNYNNDGPRELIELPNASQADPNATERLYNQAGLKVLVNSTGSNTTAISGVSVPANDRVFLTEDGTAIPASDPLETYLEGMFSSGTMTDYRENASVSTTDIDVSKVTTSYKDGGLPETIPTTTKWANSSAVPSALRGKAIPASIRGKSLWNGILYVTDVTNSSTHRTGVRLLNGASLPDGSEASSPKAGLTVASENAAYVVGDYNTGGTPPVDNASNPVGADNHITSYTVQPAAIIADAVTAVSANWTASNYNAASSLSARPPANTTINSALISGIVSSNGSDYSGGVENYIRLLENWSGRRLTYYGSIINLYASKQSTARWRDTGNYYNAPSRNWYFDTNFLDPTKLPPGTPSLRTLKRGQWVQID